MNISGFLWKNNCEGVVISMYLARMKKMLYVTGLIVISCVIASSVIEPLTTPSNKARVSNNGTYSQADGTVYILTCKNDRLVAYIKGDNAPYIETTTSISSLPHDVQLKLKEGIEFTNENDLRDTINEYIS